MSLLQYMLRPQPELSSMLTSTMKAMEFSHPIVGVHIRRTDKVGTEAAFHPVEEYMRHVEEYYERRRVENDGRPIGPKRVYVASDDPKVLAECRKKYPQYEFLGDQKVMMTERLR